MAAAGPFPCALAGVSVCSFLVVGSCLLCLCFFVTLWFCYWQFETGCDSDSMADCEIEWTNRMHMCRHIHTHNHILCQNAQGIKASCSFPLPHTKSFWEHCRVPLHSLRHPKVSKSKRVMEHMQQHSHTFSFNIDLRHQVLTRPTLKSEK